MSKQQTKGKLQTAAVQPNIKISTTVRAGLIFPVARTLKRIKKGRFAKVVRVDAGVWMTAVLEYLMAEVLELAGHACKDNKRTRVTPRHILLAIRNDPELDQLLQDVTFTEAGNNPGIHPVHLKVFAKGQKRKGSDFDIPMPRMGQNAAAEF
ncbi:histone H2A type 2-B-like protein [Mrakia frigida]|uniref:histone H2A family protein n=1 Tax=Mrakia frigida TaxID=29902 RepID=UPI003FCC22E7